MPTRPLIGVHVINKGQHNAETTKAIESIHQSSQLWPGPHAHYGTGAYAFYEDQVPAIFEGAPAVVFEPVRDGKGRLEIVDVFEAGSGRIPARRFFLIPRRPLSADPVPIIILGFLNCSGRYHLPTGTPTYV